MRPPPSLWFSILALAALAHWPSAADAQKAPRGKRAKIAEVMTAAPASIARDATIKDWPPSEGGELVVLREGKNDWVCLPSFPSAPGRDPMCIDKEWQNWLAAYMAKKDPEIKQTGYAYMLSTRTHGSNTDPFAEKATPDNHWHAIGPHVMIVHPDPKMHEAISTDPKNGGLLALGPRQLRTTEHHLV